jgi:hypothetical protein
VESPAGTLENGLPLLLTTEAAEGEGAEKETETESDKIESPEDRFETR